MSPDMNMHVGAKKGASRKPPKKVYTIEATDQTSDLAAVIGCRHGISKGYDTIGLFNSQHLRLQAAKSERRSKGRTSRSWLKVGKALRGEIKDYRESLNKK